MSEFSDVTIVKTANVYFDGSVTSRTIKFADGSTKTLGLMQPGSYEFSTAKKEHMEILLGEVDVLLSQRPVGCSFGSPDVLRFAGRSLVRRLVWATATVDFLLSGFWIQIPKPGTDCLAGKRRV